VTPRVSAIVLAFGKEALLDACLRSLDLALAEIAGPTELIVVVNRLSAEGRRQLERSTRDHVVVDPGRNLGFAGGVVAGLERARGDWIALVNDDCLVEPDALAELLAAGEQSDEIGSIAAQIRFAERADTINSAGLEVDELGVAYERLLGRPVSTSESEVVDVFGASGGAGLFRRAMLDSVAGFDESFFAYLEDADLAWRARMHGWRSVYAPRAVVEHHHSATLGHRSSEKYFLVGRNRVRMLAKNATRSQLLRRGPSIVAYDLAYVAFVAARARTLAPLRGRLSGLSEWRSYRAAGQPHRRPIRLAPSPGIRAALRRDRAYGG
jgi:GT2 family glycosyltransferase